MEIHLQCHHDTKNSYRSSSVISSNTSFDAALFLPSSPCTLFCKFKMRFTSINTSLIVLAMAAIKMIEILSNHIQYTTTARIRLYYIGHCNTYAKEAYKIHKYLRHQYWASSIMSLKVPITIH